MERDARRRLARRRLALPLTAAGHAFPDRSNVIVIAYIAIAATLVVPGLTLSPMIRRLGAEREELSEAIADAARLTYEQRIHRLRPEVDGDAADGDEAASAPAPQASTGTDRGGAQSTGPSAPAR